MRPAHAVVRWLSRVPFETGADDVQTGVYAGVYEWQGAELARHYAERMVGLLAPFSNAGTARYHVIEHGRRDDFLMHPRQAPANGAGPWWQPSDAVARIPRP